MKAWQNSMAAGVPPHSAKMLILCVDRDNDVGVKTGLETPIVGRDRCVDAATKLALADPEEADANAIFAAVREYDDLTQKGYACEVAVVAGLFERGVEADQKVLKEVRSIIQSSSIDGVVLVTDGTEDEQVIPIIQGLIPVVSVRRIIIKHSRSVEESYAVLARYLKMLIYDPRYSRYFLGVPGVLLLAIGILVVFGRLTEAIAVSLGIIGIALIVRGFELDRMVASLSKIRPTGFIRLFSMAASGLIILASIYQGFARISMSGQYAQVIENPQLIFEYGPYLLGLFLIESLNFFWAGFGVFFGGSLLYYWIRRSFKIIRPAVGLLILVLLYIPMLQFSLILMGSGSTVTLISFLLIGLAIVFLVVVIAYQYLAARRVRGR